MDSSFWSTEHRRLKAWDSRRRKPRRSICQDLFRTLTSTFEPSLEKPRFTYQDRINEDILTRHLLDVDLDPALTERYDLRHRSPSPANKRTQYMKYLLQNYSDEQI